MTVGEARLLLKDGARRQATFLELFFDVVFVFAFTRISIRSADVLTGPYRHFPSVVAMGLGKALLLLLALWAVWHLTAWTTSQYDPYHHRVQLVVISSLVASLVMGVAISRAFGERRLALACAYVLAHVSRSLILAISLRGEPERRRHELRMLTTFSMTGALWITGAVLPLDWRLPLWLLALATEWITARAGFPVPGLGRSPAAKLRMEGEHLAERYQQFLLIALGEAILVTGRVYAEGAIGTGETAAFAIAVATTVLIWRIYFHRAGQILPEAINRSTSPARMGWSTTDSHLIMLAGIVTTAVGFHVTIEHPHGDTQAAWIAVILGGPALFTIGRARFEHEVFSRVSPSRIIVLLTLAALFPAMIHLPPLAAAAAAAAVLTAAAVADARRAWGRPPEQPKPSP
ncbi:low temperature requirement protein A [Micromonospora sp. CB01531]|nr:low temperature requirement protein A [Micromonospora sp. CB01531]